MNMFDFNDNFHSQINLDRGIMRDLRGETFIVFRRCNHCLPIKSYILDAMGRYEMINLINSLQCRDCEREFSEVAHKLHLEYVQFIKNGGKL